MIKAFLKILIRKFDEHVNENEKKIKFIKYINRYVTLKTYTESNFIYGFIYFFRYLDIKETITYHDFICFFVLSIALASKMYDDWKEKINLMDFYDDFCLCGEYESWESFKLKEIELLKLLEYNLVLKEESFSILKSYFNKM